MHFGAARFRYDAPAERLVSLRVPSSIDWVMKGPPCPNHQQAHRFGQRGFWGLSRMISGLLLPQLAPPVAWRVSGSISNPLNLCPPICWN